jgi:hypothetical protein
MLLQETIGQVILEVVDYQLESTAISATVLSAVFAVEEASCYLLS